MIVVDDTAASVGTAVAQAQSRTETESKVFRDNPLAQGRARTVRGLPGLVARPTDRIGRTRANREIVVRVGLVSVELIQLLCDHNTFYPVGSQYFPGNRSLAARFAIFLNHL